MNEEQMQVNNPQMAQEMTADESAASLAFATHLQDQLIPRQSPENAPEQEKKPMMEKDTEENDKDDEILSQIKDIRSELQTLLQQDEEEQ